MGAEGSRRPRGMPTLSGSGAHQGDHPALQAIPAQHNEAKAVGGSRCQAREQERILGGVELEYKLSIPSCSQLFCQDHTGAHVPRRQRPVQNKVGGLSLALYILHRTRLYGEKSQIGVSRCQGDHLQARGSGSQWV